MKRTKLAIAFSLAALLPFAAAAQEAPSNTWVEGSYVHVDGDADGHAVRGSFEFGETNLYGLGGLSRVHVDDSPLKLDAWELGLGYALPMGTASQLFAEAAYLDSEVVVPGLLEGLKNVSRLVAPWIEPQPAVAAPRTMRRIV